MGWFRSLQTALIEVPSPRGLALYFPEFGPLAQLPDGSIDVKASPIATVFLPRLRRGVLWTVGEVHFLSTPLRERFPGLHRVSRELSRWLKERDCVYSAQSACVEYAYYLEGSIRNFDSAVYAFESGLAQLRSGRYFVADDDDEIRLDNLCRSLRLRGVECAGV